MTAGIYETFFGKQSENGHTTVL